MRKPVLRFLVAKAGYLLGIITTSITIFTPLGVALILGIIIVVASVIVYIISILLFNQKACDRAVRLIGALKRKKTPIP